MEKSSSDEEPEEGSAWKGAARDERGERREQHEETQRVGKRSRLPVSIDPPKRSRAHIVFHPSSVAISLYHERVSERKDKGEKIKIRENKNK